MGGSQEGWPREDWAQLLVLLLTREVQQVYYALPAEGAASYSQLKEKILNRCGLSAIRATSKSYC